MRVDGIEWTPARLQNRQLNLAEFGRRQARLESLPRALFIELTENCNLSCPMCRSAGPFDRAKNMDPAIFAKVADALFPTAEIVDLRGWGESTILRNFPDYVERTLAHGCRIRLVTNLTVPRPDLWRRLVRADSLIVVSYDAADEETFAALRGGAKLSVVKHNLTVLVEECESSGISLDNIHLNVVVQQAALGELAGIVRYAATLGLRVRLNPVTLDEGDQGALSNHRDEVLAGLDEAATAAAETGTRVFENAALLPEFADHGKTDKTCSHPWMYSYVNYKGEVGFCDHLIGVPGQQYLLGDLRTQDFSAIWNNPAYLRLRSEHARGKEALSERFEECRWCYANRYTDFDELTNPEYLAYQKELRPCPQTDGHLSRS